MSTTVTILGATGSIGQSAAAVIEADRERFSVQTVTANGDAAGLAATAIRIGAKKAVIRDPSGLDVLRSALSGHDIVVACGEDDLEDAASEPVDVTLSAIVGAAGVRPTVAAVKAGNRIALANKECLICAGTSFIRLAEECGSEILPVDSEHNAAHQLFQRQDRLTVKTLTLTASGGPFLEWSSDKLSNVTVAEALDHPIWSMGAKISIDSATLMNKGLELIEAKYLFGLSPSELDVVVHPQSIVHALITLTDGSVHADLGAADMRRPIAYCLYWPDRRKDEFSGIALDRLANLTFLKPDVDRFPALRIAREAMEQGCGAETVLNAANEVAVKSFLENKIMFTEIADIVARTLAESERLGLLHEPDSIDTALTLDGEARRIASQFVPQEQVLRA